MLKSICTMWINDSSCVFAKWRHSATKFLNKQNVNDCVQHIILQKFTNFHAIRSWNFRIFAMRWWPRFFCATLYLCYWARCVLCLAIVCSAPPSIGSGTYTAPANFEYSALAFYECFAGFKFLDGRTRKNLRCNEFGYWNETDVSCRCQLLILFFSEKNTHI